jgi:hypothetical protein
LLKFNLEFIFKLEQMDDWEAYNDNDYHFSMIYILYFADQATFYCCKAEIRSEGKDARAPPEMYITQRSADDSICRSARQKNGGRQPQMGRPEAQNFTMWGKNADIAGRFLSSIATRSTLPQLAVSISRSLTRIYKDP